MITRQQAIDVAKTFIQKTEDDMAKWIGRRIKLVLMDERTQDTEFGWVFVFDSEEHIASNNTRDRLYGTGGLIVDAEDGSLHKAGSRHPIEYYVDRYRQERALRQT